MPRFVILRHFPGRLSDRGLHWDLMLEESESLRTWALESTPDVASEVPCRQLDAHRKIYLEYEGPVSGERGDVSRWDAGQFDWEKDEPDEIRVKLKGQSLRGELTLTANGDGYWTARFSPSL